MLDENIGCICYYCNIYFNLATTLCISGLTVICIKLLLTYLLTFKERNDNNSNLSHQLVNIYSLNRTRPMDIASSEVSLSR